MTAILAPPLVFQGLSAQGVPLAGGLLASYIAGTTTPQATYVDSTQSTPNTNPIVLNASGQCALWLDPAKVYKFVLTDVVSNQLYVTDQVQGSLTAAAVSTILTQAYLGSILNPQTPAELAAGVTPVNLYVPSHLVAGLALVERYGNNTIPQTTDMTAAMQAAVNVGLQAKCGVGVQTLCLLTSSVNLDRLVDGAAFDNYFRIVGIGGGGFYVATNIAMFSSTIAFTTAPVTQLWYFDGIAFISSAAGTGKVLNDGRFLRTRFHGCSFDKINCCVSTIGYSQSIQFTNCNMRRGSGVFWTSGGTSGYFSTDFHFDNNIVEAWTGDFLHLGLPVGCTITNNLLEGISGTALVLNGSQGCTIEGNYSETTGVFCDFTNQGAPIYPIDGVALIGNRIQGISTTTYQVIWTTIDNAFSAGNNCNGYLHNIPANSHLVGVGGDYSPTITYSNLPLTERGGTGALSTWTPVDASGASLAFTGVIATYSISGNGRTVDFDFELVYPATASGANAAIGGLPFASISGGLTFPISGGTTYTTYTASLQIAGGPGVTSFNLLNLSTNVTNANLSGKLVRMFGRYQANI